MSGGSIEYILILSILLYYNNIISNINNDIYFIYIYMIYNKYIIYLYI